MAYDDWTLCGVGVEEVPLEIEGTDVWSHEWYRLEFEPLVVAHPQYPQQRHKLWPYCIEPEQRCVLFAAGELSNGVWCFYAPDQQPQQTSKGMTVNEMLYAHDLSDAFDSAIDSRSPKHAKSLLILAGLNPAQASESVETILANPGVYGFKEGASDKDDG